MNTAELPGVDAPVLGPDDARDMLDRQTEVLELIAAAVPLHDVLAEILNSLERLIPGARCSVLLLDRERRTLHHGAAPSLPVAYVAAIDGLAIGDHAGSCGTAAALNTAVVTADVRTDPRWVEYRAHAESAGLRSCWSTPIQGRDGMPVGTFAVYHDAPHRPSGREQLLVDRFTHLASVAIEHADLVGELVASEERFRRSFDDNSLGMALVGLDRRIARCNTALASLARGRAGEVYNVGGVNEKPNMEVIRRLLAVLGKPETLIRHVKDRPGHDRRYALSAAKIRSELGWEPKVAFEQGIEDTVRWYVDNPQWWGKIVSGEYRQYYERMYGNR